ncbi:HAD family hydrolase [Niastella populi]|uniref:Haloacid dehalogenase n=1 Tax=Niastella populi TaxID=550983 RepID=A0A1V9FXE3_9BACT|nr:HAD family phosphatase [Niastella populi]OQP62990.1 haloacid dehalogenase [Niastella populi]
MDKAFLFDLNGTMIDDMEFHLKAWYHILNDDLGAGLSWEDTKVQMYGKNTELLVRIFGPNKFTQEEMDRLSVEKEKRYQQEYKPHLKLIPGLHEFLEKAHAMHIPMAIGSAAIMFNIDFVLDNLNIRHYFKAIVSADDVTTSKPHPETYLKCAEILGVDQANCLVFEDAPKGVEAALNAGMPSVVLTATTLHEKEEFTVYNNIIQYITDYTQLSPADLVRSMAV